MNRTDRRGTCDDTTDGGDCNDNDADDDYPRDYCPVDVCPPPDPPATILNSDLNIRGVNSALSVLLGPNGSGCASALGAGTASGAINDLQHVTIDPNAHLALNREVTETPGGGYTSSWSGTFGYWDGATLQLNGDVGDLTHFVVGQAYGKDVVINILTETEKNFGLMPGSLDVETYWAIFVLHELGPDLGGLPNDKDNGPLSKANTQTVIDNCFGSLKQ